MPEFGIHLERKNQIAIMPLNRPEMRNALNEAMWADLDKVTASLDVDF